MLIIQKKIQSATIHIKDWNAYDGLILNCYDHYRIFHSNNEFARMKIHVNGLEYYWSFAKNGVVKINDLVAIVLFVFKGK